MQRKYRGQRADTKEWINGYYLQINGKPIIIQPTDSYKYYKQYFLDIPFNEVIPETVGQHTGLKDKNGKEIYEGDILIDSLGWVFTVEWDTDNARFLGRHAKPRGDTYICYVGREPKAEIIGSIFDNPELLQEVENV